MTHKVDILILIFYLSLTLSLPLSTTFLALRVILRIRVQIFIIFETIFQHFSVVLFSKEFLSPQICFFVYILKKKREIYAENARCLLFTFHCSPQCSWLDFKICIFPPLWTHSNVSSFRFAGWMLLKANERASK